MHEWNINIMRGFISGYNNSDISLCASCVILRSLQQLSKNDNIIELVCTLSCSHSLILTTSVVVRLSYQALICSMQVVVLVSVMRRISWARRPTNVTELSTGLQRGMGMVVDWYTDCQSWIWGESGYSQLKTPSTLWPSKNSQTGEKKEVRQILVWRARPSLQGWSSSPDQTDICMTIMYKV